MIRAILIINNHGKPRLIKFYEHYVCLNCCLLLVGGQDYRLIYRHYATLYFVFCVDSSESELGILDLIQVFVEALDKCFENVCELDLIFHVDKSGLSGAPARAVSAMRDLNLHQKFKEIRFPDLQSLQNRLSR
ncbi:unnamed protein product [Schistosoma margrebowiei]|uniref:Uncharacterized protein n=1 Tax=Schistosoma margrebowiei TaxID=48269 RepID=A0A183MEU7_9TREM|nr:unnamed protein product [Schistosoma margrebowiei]